MPLNKGSPGKSLLIFPFPHRLDPIVMAIMKLRKVLGVELVDVSTSEKLIAAIGGGFMQHPSAL